MIRRAFAITTAQRYIALALNFATLIILSRILTPQEIGTGAVGSAVALVAVSLREFATTNFFVQRADLAEQDVRGGFSVMLLITSCLAGTLAVSAPWLASALGDPRLAPFLRILSVLFVVELVPQVLLALMQRDMEFDKIAVTGIAGHAFGSLLIVTLALLGFSYMSIAWGWLASVATSAALAVWFRPDLRILRPSPVGWRPMLAFGGYNGVTTMLHRAYDQFPYLVLGRVLTMSEAGIYNRALNLSQTPQKMVLGGIFTLMFPVLASQVRAGLSVKEPYLNAVAYITAVQWPALVLLAIVTQPAVGIVLGSQWIGTVPIVQILALVALFSPCTELNHATLISVGAIREFMWRSLVAIPFAAIVLGAAARFGLETLALSFFITVPIYEFLMLQAVQRRVRFAWSELGAVLRRSAVVTACSAAGPLALVAAGGFHFDLSLGMAVVAGALGAAGWLVGLWLTRHPLLGELRYLAHVVGRNLVAGCSRVRGARRGSGRRARQGKSEEAA
ncbi:MAG TPA: oligosaccharide flippase family protein [Hyphomicrobiaceae bacterium]|jgi:O-antigen/teichoic acid export membrane protein|nr:oligosaccharide flippase family protein [Hyphomicrobiaceae bacterium]